MLYKRLLRAEPAPVPPGYSPDEQSETIDILARTLWGEARGENLAGKEAVASVILNRVRFAQRRGDFWWGNCIRTVCQKPFQFSCWNEGDPNHAKIRAVTPADPNFALCQRIARRGVNGLLPDNTFGADHYHADHIHPRWAEGRVPTVIVGAHLFYRLTL